MPIAQDPLSVEVTLPREDVALLTVEGYLDVDTATEFQHHLANQLHHGRRHFLLDLSAVPFMDSSGMNIILRVYQEARELPGSVHIIRPTSAVRANTGSHRCQPSRASRSPGPSYGRARPSTGRTPRPREEH
ncbi:Anti-sigma factor antagonist OS=Streptomyces fumanus OX=67302 GN=GCM10018772_54480 PE=3 SV=1 [Streptomyces fumanus]